MTGEDIFGLILYAGVALLMIGIGICQLRSRDPVGFWTGEPHPKAEELTDVRAWNRRHGIGWILYGVVILAGWLGGFLMGDTLFSLIPMCGGILGGVIAMIFYHKSLERRYRRQSPK